MGIRLYTCDHHEILLPPDHKFPVQKYRRLRKTLATDSRFEILPARLADREEIERVHTTEYVSSFLKGMLEPSEMRRIGFPWSQNLVKRTLASVGGTVDAARDALAAGLGGNLAGGTHHAFPDYGGGFCVFNDIAIAIRALQVERLARRFAVLDLDVHQGDGTAAIFRGDPEVLTVSMHSAFNFPFRKQESGIDVPLPDGVTNAAFLEKLEALLPRVFAFSPEILFYQSGVDGLASDELGRLSLSRSGLERRDRLVLTACKEQGIPVAITLGGGYAEPITDSVLAHAATFRTAADLFSTR